MLGPVPVRLSVDAHSRAGGAAHTDMIFNEEYASRVARALGLAPY
jgi:hypothetical protein